MNREQYLHLRNNNELGEICYRYYKMKAEDKGLEPYDVEFFIRAFNMWIAVDDYAITLATSYYDNLFTIQTLMYKNKEIRYT